MAQQNSNNLKPFPITQTAPPIPIFSPSEPDFGVPPPPPFDPGTPVSIADLEAKLNALLQPTQSTEPQPGLGRRLLATIPDAIAVLLSRDPSTTLANQLKELRAIQAKREEREQARKDRLEDIRRTTGIDLVRGEIENRRRTASEKRQYEQQVRLTQQEQQFKTSEREAATEAQFRLAEYDVTARRKLQESANDFQLKLVNLANQRDDMARYVTQREKHRQMGIPSDVIDEMANADVKGLPYSPRAQKYVDAWTADEKSYRDKARKLDLEKTRSEIAENLAQAQHARAAAAAASAKAMNFEWVDKEAWGLTADGRMVILDKQAKNPVGQYIDEKGIEITPLDQRQARAIYMMREAQNELSSSKGLGAKVSGSEDRVQAQYWDNIIAGERNAKKSDDEIVTKLRRSAEAQPQTRQFIEQAIIRNGLEKKKEKAKTTSIKIPIGAYGASSSINIPISTEGRYGAIGRSIEGGALRGAYENIKAVPGVVGDIFGTMFQKNTPEENLRRLEQLRRQGAFGPTPTPTPKP